MESTKQNFYNFITDKDSHIFIVASAGTGKTYTIQKILSEMVQNDVSIEKIAIVTFTEKAGGELQDRIRQELSDRVQSEKKPIKFQIALDNLLNAHIGTIHSFCRRILKRYSTYTNSSEFSPNYTELENGEELYDAAFKQFWGKEEKMESPELKKILIELGYGRFKSFLIQASLVSHGKSIFNEFPKPKSFTEITKILSQLKSYILVQKLDTSKDKDKNLSQFIDTPLKEENSNQLHEYLVSGFLTGTGNLDKNIYKSKIDKSIEYEELSNIILSVSEEFNYIFTYPVLVYLVQCINSFNSIFREYLKAKDTQLTEHLILYTRDLLLANPIIQEKIAENYEYVLIDESQDTDPVQLDLFLEIARTNQVHLLFVGDPKQSIYRFRSADIESFYLTTKKLSNRKDYTLDSTFRSSKQLTEVLNSLFIKISSLNYSSVHCKRIEKQELTKSISPALILLGLDENNQMLIYEKTEIKLRDQIKLDSAVEIVQMIQKIVHNPEFLILDKNSKTYREIEYSDIAVLSQSNKNFDILEKEFKKNNLYYSIYKDRKFFEHKIILSLLDLLYSIDNPYNSLALYNVLSSDLFLIEDEILYKQKKYGGFSYKEISCIEELKDIFRSLREANQERYQKSASYLIRKILEEHHILDRLSIGFESRRNLTDIYHFFELLDSLQYKESLSFGAMIQRLRKELATEKEKEIKMENETTSLDVISLMTFHASKGLEFPVCILYDLTGEFDRLNQTGIKIFKNDLRLRDSLTLDFKLNKSIFTEGYERLDNFDSIQNLRERERLLYVAITRARDYLILPLHLDKRNIGKNNTYREILSNAFSSNFVNEYLSEQKAINSKLYKYSDIGDELKNSPIEEQYKLDIEQLKQRVTPSLDIILRHSGFTIESYTSLDHKKQRIKSFYEKPTELDDVSIKDSEEKPQRLNISENTIYADFGVCCHAILENFDLRLLSKSDKIIYKEMIVLAEKYFTILKEEEKEFYTKKDAIQFCFRALTKKYLIDPHSQKEMIPSEWKYVQRERHFYTSIEEKKDHFYMGIGDGMFFWEGKYYIIDWKTNYINNKSPEALLDIVNEKYSNQYYIYSLNLLKNLTYRASTDIEKKTIWEQSFGGMIFHFIRETLDYTGIVIVQPTYDELIQFMKE